MKSRKLLNFLSMIFTLLILFNFSACNEDLYWIARSGEEELPVGSYIYNLYLAYNESKSKVEDSEKSPLEQQIEEISGEEWIKNKALDYTKEAIAWQLKMKEIGTKLDEEYLAQATQYIDQMGLYNAKFMKDLGVARESFTKAYINRMVAEESVLRALYDEGGSQAVSKEDIKKYFSENYIAYQCIQEQYQPDAKDEDKAKIKESFESFVKEVNSGESMKSVAEKYQKEKNLQKSPFSEDLCKKSSLTFGDDINKKLEEIEYEKATLLETDTTVYVFVKISLDREQEVDTILSKGSKIRLEILRELKEEELKNMINQYKENLNIDINQGVIDKYTPKFVEKKINEDKKKQEKASKRNKSAARTIPQKEEGSDEG